MTIPEALVEEIGNAIARVQARHGAQPSFINGEMIREIIDVLERSTDRASLDFLGKVLSERR